MNSRRAANRLSKYFRIVSSNLSLSSTGTTTLLVASLPGIKAQWQLPAAPSRDLSPNRSRARTSRRDRPGARGPGFKIFLAQSSMRPGELHRQRFSYFFAKLPATRNIPSGSFPLWRCWTLWVVTKFSREEYFQIFQKDA